MSLAEKLGINQTNLAERLSFLKLGPAEINRLASLKKWMDRRAPTIARSFYDFQFSHPASRRFFDAHARQHGIKLGKLRSHLEVAQSQYLRDITDHADRGGLGPDYFEKRLQVGKLHNDIGLPMKLYLGSYALYYELIRRQLWRDFWYRPLFRARAMEAIERVLLLDMQAVTDGFLIDLLDTLDLSGSIAVERQHEDVTDYIGDYRAKMRAMLSGMREAADALGREGGELAGMVESLSSAAQEEAAAIQEMNTNLSGIQELTRQGEAHSRAAVLTAIGDGESSKSAVGAMDEISRSAEEITSIVDMINEIAFQTNLLALNAAVEAARAGHEGRGFAVVASEVKRLSDRTSESADQIRKLIARSSANIEEGSGYVKQVSEQVEEIATALREQSTAVTELGTAVQEIDRTAQANANDSQRLQDLAGKLGTRAEQLSGILDNR
ncbi:methyl-accepting chemotaxis protein [Natronospira sp.]|uniref:methyl-accepting chemotaxis protein n=1 Tax=Natronospira sp. TaxID=2024970 RepID=UPI00387376BF